MTGRILVTFLLICTLLAGGGMYYLQVYAYYITLPAQNTVALTPMGALAAQDFAVANFEGIDSTSSPIRYRACFDIATDPAALTPYAGATPLIAPGWFDCFDAGTLTDALAAGRANAVMGQSNVTYGIDRVVVLLDGRGYAWHQINACGLAHFDRDPVPAGCPTPPQE